MTEEGGVPNENEEREHREDEDVQCGKVDKSKPALSYLTPDERQLSQTCFLSLSPSSNQNVVFLRRNVTLNIYEKLA